MLYHCCVAAKADMQPRCCIAAGDAVKAGMKDLYNIASCDQAAPGILDNISIAAKVAGGDYFYYSPHSNLCT